MPAAGPLRNFKLPVAVSNTSWLLELMSLVKSMKYLVSAMNLAMAKLLVLGAEAGYRATALKVWKAGTAATVVVLVMVTIVESAVEVVVIVVKGVSVLQSVRGWNVYHQWGNGLRS